MKVDIGVLFWGERGTTTAFEQLLILLLIDVDWREKRLYWGLKDTYLLVYSIST